MGFAIHSQKIVFQLTVYNINNTDKLSKNLDFHGKRLKDLKTLTTTYTDKYPDQKKVSLQVVLKYLFFLNLIPKI